MCKYSFTTLYILYIRQHALYSLMLYQFCMSLSGAPQEQQTERRQSLLTFHCCEPLKQRLSEKW